MYGSASIQRHVVVFVVNRQISKTGQARQSRRLAESQTYGQAFQIWHALQSQGPRLKPHGYLTQVTGNQLQRPANVTATPGSS